MTRGESNCLLSVDRIDGDVFDYLSYSPDWDTFRVLRGEGCDTNRGPEGEGSINGDNNGGGAPPPIAPVLVGDDPNGGWCSTKIVTKISIFKDVLLI